MSNSVNNLKNSVFYLFLLCFLSSCVVEEEHRIHEDTGLEWTFKKYRNGDESVTIGKETIKGEKVEAYVGYDQIVPFFVFSDSIYIYEGTESTFKLIGVVPRPAYNVSCSFVHVYPDDEDGNTRFFNSDQAGFWFELTHKENEKYITELYTNKGVHITTLTGHPIVYGDTYVNKHNNDHIVFYHISEKYRGDKGIYDTEGKEIIPIRYPSISKPLFWSYADEVNNSNYFFIAYRGKYSNSEDYRYIDIYSQSGNLLLSIDSRDRQYATNGKQYSFSNPKIEYKQTWEKAEQDKDYDYGLYAEFVFDETFKGHNIFLINEFDIDYRHAGDLYSLTHKYYITMIDNEFYVIHKYDPYGYVIIESIKIPVASTINMDNVSSSSTNTKSALDMVRDVLMTDITDSFFEDPKSYFIQKATIGKRTDTYEKGESFLIIGDNRMITQWADGSSSTDKMAPKNITIYDHLDGEEKKALAYVSDDGLAVRAMNSSGTKFIILYAYNESMKCYVQMGGYTLYN